VIFPGKPARATPRHLQRGANEKGLFIVRKFSRISACLVAAGLLSGAVVAGSAVAADAGTVGSCSAHGANADCAAGGHASKPGTMAFSVTSSPSQNVFVAWTVVCSQGGKTKKASGTFAARTPLSRSLPRPFTSADLCIAAAGAALSGSGSVHVTVWSSHQIAGLANLCAAQKGSTAKVVTGTCNGGGAQQWSLRRGQLVHGGKCAGATSGPVALSKCNGSANQRWSHNSKGEYVLKGRCLTDPGSSKKSGTQLTVAACRGGANQRWSLP
jgi:hypothetical protein